MLTVPVCPQSGKITALSSILAPEGGGGSDGEIPPSSRPIPREREPPLPQSHLLLRDDGVAFVSLEEAEGRELEGREVIRCVALLPEELKQARAAAADGFAEGVAVVLGALPWRKP